METIHFSHTHSRSTSVFNTPSSRSLFSVVLVSLAVLLSGCASQQKTQAFEVSGDGTLTVALYKYVPNIEAFKTAVTTVWNELTDAPPIKFVDWDCYVNDPPANLDVFVFDGLYMSHYAESGFLRPLKAGEVSNEGDLLAYSVEGSKYKGTLYGIPQI